MDRQKVLLIFGIALLASALLSWFLYAQTQAPKTEKTVRIVAAARDLPAGTRLRKNDLKLVAVPEKDLPKAAMLDDRTALDRALLFPVNQNEPLVSTKLTGITGAEGLPAIIEHGKRAVSVQVTDASGAAGLIQPRSKVDVLFTRPGSMAEAITTTILQDVTVLSMGRMTEVGQQPVDPRQARPSSQAATLLVTPEEAAKLELAKNQGKISLALRNPLDRSRLEDSTPVTAEVLDPMYYGRVARARRGAAIPNVRDRQVWEGLTGEGQEKRAEKKEPPKPKLVVDVYRGDKHVQEIFQ
jgi:pilus assembly protein CpaB